ncbi:MAG: VPLPA-CTERM-specific exosortase XrtD [Nitrospira sp.]|nr:MAG: VPLPA-CTERM-specific exosortase XrtD [Nitrospira sp.]
MVIGLLAVAFLGYMYAGSLRFMVEQWGSDDYSHGFFVPIVSLFLIWLRWHRVVRAGIRPSWWGSGLVLVGVSLYVVGDYATLYIVLHLSLWLVIVGLVLSMFGHAAVREMAFPLLYLLMSIPLPVFLYSALSGQLQLWSSALGVGCLQFVGVTAFREGNIIDLGPVQLQVAEACSGIRYLFPLTSLALLCAYLFRDQMWKRALLVLSALPISVLVNGFRIGVVGILVELYGSQAAEGFLHLFEGWVLFMATLGLLVLEMWCLSKLHRLPDAGTFADQFSWLDEPDRNHAQHLNHPATKAVGMSPQYLCSVAILIPFAALSWMIGERQDTPPPRPAFIDFSMDIGSWHGTPLTMEQQYISALRFDDYLLADYDSGDGTSVNLYMAYYRSQKKGQSAHSPQSCIPGGGWEISSHRTIDLPVDENHGSVYPVNRITIQKGHEKQLILYWFKQRERLLSSEYLVKTYLFWDALTRGRSDGALIRLAAAVEPGQNEADVERHLTELARLIQPELTHYVPD